MVRVAPPSGASVRRNFTTGPLRLHDGVALACLRAPMQYLESGLGRGDVHPPAHECHGGQPRGGSMLHRRRHLASLFVATALVATLGAAPVAAVDPAPSTTTLNVDDQGHFLQDNHPFALIAVIAPDDVDFSTDATVDFVDTDGIGPSCLAVAVDAGNATTCPIDDLAAGTYHYQATYSGNAVLATSQSDIVEVVVAPDTVEATAVGVSLGKFYPYKDGYRDTVRISGNRLEPISVAIRIYNSNNKRVKLVTRSLATGAYGYTWNGRKSGTLLPAGTYRVVQKLTDAAGTSKTVTKYVKLSHKRLVTKTAYVTKAGDKITAGGTSGSGSLSHTSSGTLLLRAGTGSASAGWQFKIPSAVIYKSIRFQVDAASPLAVPSTLIAMQNFNWCSKASGWDLGCFNRVKSIGNTSGSRRWYSDRGSVSANRSGLTVRGLIWVGQGKVYVYKVRVKVVYQVLR
jgi:hypothetical protein